MSTIQRLALISAAHNHVALEGTEAESLTMFLTLKAQAESDSQIKVGQLGAIEIPGQYDFMTVLELVEMIEQEASQLVSFSNRVIEAAHRGMVIAVEEPGIELDTSQWSLSTFAETQLVSELSADVLEVVSAQELITRLAGMHPEKRWSLYPIGDYCQYAEADAPDVLVSFECSEQELNAGLVDPCSTMIGQLCDPAVWGLSEEAAQLMKAFNKVNIAKYPNGDGPKAG